MLRIPCEPHLRPQPFLRCRVCIEQIGRKKEEGDLRQRTKEFALAIIRLFGTWPKTPVAQVIGKQLLRAGTSIGANYREAYRGRSKPEFIAKCGDSLRELEECGYWLELLVEARICSPATLEAVRNECDELTAIFVAIIKRARANP